MRIRFTVTGRTRAELELGAAEILRALLEGKPPATADMTVRPLVESYGTTIPAMWEGEVDATA